MEPHLARSVHYLCSGDRFLTRMHTIELNGRPAVHCRNRFASLKRIQKSLDPDSQGETLSGTSSFVDPMNVLVSFLLPHNRPSNMSAVDPQPLDSLLESKQFSMLHPSTPTVTLFSLPRCCRYRLCLQYGLPRARRRSRTTADPRNQLTPRRRGTTWSLPVICAF